MKNKLNIASKVVGIIVTLFMLLAFGPKFIESVNNEGVKYLLEIPRAFVNWYDNPIAFFITYFIGYAIIWWKPLWGSLLILIGCALFFAFNSQNMGTFIFTIPTGIVAILYILHWENMNENES